MKKNTLMPTYEQLAVNNAKLSQEVLRLTRAVERLKRKRPGTATKVVYKETGWMWCIISLSVFIVIVGAAIIKEKYMLWN